MFCQLLYLFTVSCSNFTFNFLNSDVKSQYFIVFKVLPSFFFYSAGYFDFDSGTADEEQTRHGISQHGQKILTP